MTTLTCLRPVTTGEMLWSREMRDQDRAVDPARCLCGGENCRDAEVKEDDD